MSGLLCHFRFHHKSISTITRPEIVSTFLYHNTKIIRHDNCFLTRYKWNVKNLRSCSSVSALQMQNEEGSGGGGGGVSMVQGASRGIGLEFVRQLLDSYGKGHVIATCRNPDCAEGLLDLKRKHTDRLTLIHLDVTDESSISVAAKIITKTHGRLDLLVNTSGILCVPTVLKPETTLSKVEKSSLLLSFEVNAVGPILVIKHMCPLLRNGGGQDTGRAAAIVVNLSARVGSIGDNRLGGWHSYRSSKAALNQFFCCRLPELKEEACMLALPLPKLLQQKHSVSCSHFYAGSIRSTLSSLQPSDQEYIFGIRKTKGPNHLLIITSWDSGH